MGKKLPCRQGWVKKFICIHSTAGIISRHGAVWRGRDRRRKEFLKQERGKALLLSVTALHIYI